MFKSGNGSRVNKPDWPWSLRRGRDAPAPLHLRAVVSPDRRAYFPPSSSVRLRRI